MSGTATVTGNLPALLSDGVTPVPAGNITGINIYRTTGSGTAAKIGAATISGTSFSYTDTGLAAGPYNYGATAVNAAGEGGMSNLFPVVVPLPAEVPGPPTIVNVTLS
jgi:hypothetical protein